MIATVAESEWISLREAAVLTGKHENTIRAHREMIKHRRRGYGKRSPLEFNRRSLLRWVKAYHVA